MGENSGGKWPRGITQQHAPLRAGGEATAGRGLPSFGHGPSVCPGGGSFLREEQLSSSCRQQKGKMCEERVLGGIPGLPGTPFSAGAAYSFGRSCRSFFTQRALGSTQTLSRDFSLILENTRGFGTTTSNPSRGRLREPSPLLAPTQCFL